MKTGQVKILRVLLVLVILALTLYLVDYRLVGKQLSGMRPGWLALGILLCHTTYWVFAWRWWYLAKRADAAMSYGQSLSDYLLGGLFNQVLPTGLAGPVYRAFRHAKRDCADSTPVGIGRALSIVALDRVSGLAAQAFITLLGTIALAFSYPWIGLWGTLAVLLTLIALVTGLRLASRRYEEFESALALAFRGRTEVLKIGISSLLGVFLLSLAFYCAAQAIALELPFWRVICVSPLILGAMVIPLSIAGWGIREAASGALFLALGTNAAIGVAVSVSFGLMGLLSTSPGLVLWFFVGRDSQPGQVLRK